MHARVRIHQVQPGKIDEAIGFIRDTIVSAVEQQKGFKGLLLLVDRNTAKSMVISLWETEADMMADETSEYMQEQRAKGAHLAAVPPVTEHYEIAVQA